MKIHSLPCITGCLLIAVSSTVYAQSSTAVSGQRLAAIEHEMFNDSNRDFIVVDLVMDNVITPGKDFVFRYDKDGVCFVDDKKLGASLQSKYKNRIEQFQQFTGGSLKTIFSITAAISEKEILDPNSSFRKPAFNGIKDIPRKQRMNEATQEVITQMAGEHLIDTVADYKLLVNKTGIYVNDKKLDIAVAEKYIPLFKQAMHVQPGFDDYYFREEGGGAKK